MWAPKSWKKRLKPCAGFLQVRQQHATAGLRFARLFGSWCSRFKAMSRASDETSSEVEGTPGSSSSGPPPITPEVLDSLSPLEKAFLRQAHRRAPPLESHPSRVEPTAVSVGSARPRRFGRRRWGVMALALLALGGYGVFCVPLPDGKPNVEDPDITEERHVRPWREITRFLQTHGDVVLKDLDTFRKARHAPGLLGRRGSPITMESGGFWPFAGAY
jgi:hypothetical protein